MTVLKDMSATDRVAPNGEPTLEARLRQLFHSQGELLVRQDQLRGQMEATRTELDRISAEITQTQEMYCTDPQREDEYFRCLKALLGEDPREVVAAIEEAKKNPVSLDDFIAELQHEKH